MLSGPDNYKQDFGLRGLRQSCPRAANICLFELMTVGKQLLLACRDAANSFLEDLRLGAGRSRADCPHGATHQIQCEKFLHEY